MTGRPLRSILSVLLLAGLLLLPGCAGRRAPSAIPEANAIGVYRGRLVDHDEGDSRKFRVLLFAQAPDRVHAEVVSPLGQTHLILDGGGGRLALTFVRDGTSFVGDARPEVLGEILGVRLGLADLVGGLLTGRVEARGFDVVREATRSGVLPDRLEIRSERASLALELKRLKPLRVSATDLGTGRPPDGTSTRPLSELGLDELRDEALPDAPGEAGP